MKFPIVLTGSVLLSQLASVDGYTRLAKCHDCQVPIQSALTANNISRNSYEFSCDESRVVINFNNQKSYNDFKNLTNISAQLPGHNANCPHNFRGEYQGQVASSGNKYIDGYSATIAAIAAAVVAM
jgi:hypothetical protein